MNLNAHFIDKLYHIILQNKNQILSRISQIVLRKNQLLNEGAEMISEMLKISNL